MELKKAHAKILNTMNKVGAYYLNSNMPNFEEEFDAVHDLLNLDSITAEIISQPGFELGDGDHFEAIVKFIQERG
jgi:hypothetical protein